MSSSSLLSSSEVNKLKVNRLEAVSVRTSGLQPVQPLGETVQAIVIMTLVPGLTIEHFKASFIPFFINDAKTNNTYWYNKYSILENTPGEITFLIDFTSPENYINYYNEFTKNDFATYKFAYTNIATWQITQSGLKPLRAIVTTQSGKDKLDKWWTDNIAGFNNASGGTIIVPQPDILLDITGGGAFARY